MWILLLNTAETNSYVSLFHGEALVSERRSSMKDQSRFLLPAIDSLLHESQLSIEQISFIAICIGPGSFTGTRIGVMTAKTLSYALSIPLIPFSLPTPDSLLPILISQFRAQEFANPQTLDTLYESQKNI